MFPKNKGNPEIPALVCRSFCLLLRNGKGTVALVHIMKAYSEVEA
jgi:hypothetical protein